MYSVAGNLKISPESTVWSSGKVRANATKDFIVSYGSLIIDITFFPSASEGK
jgi:hypothetical protein